MLGVVSVVLSQESGGCLRPHRSDQPGGGGGARGAWQRHCRVIALLRHRCAYFCAIVPPDIGALSALSSPLCAAGCACCMSQVGCLCGLSCLNFYRARFKSHTARTPMGRRQSPACKQGHTGGSRILHVLAKQDKAFLRDEGSWSLRS